MVVAGRGIDRDVGHDFAVDLHIDLIDAVSEILVVVGRDAVVFEQAPFKLGLPAVAAGVFSGGGRRCRGRGGDDGRLNGRAAGVCAGSDAAAVCLPQAVSASRSTAVSSAAACLRWVMGSSSLVMVFSVFLQTFYIKIRRNTTLGCKIQM